MAPGLITQNTLRFRTEIGVCNIELCVGDITKLPKEEKVDVLVVSAFPGDYSPTPSSLIGQLSIQLGVSVRKLSQDKEEDLRRQYFCWWSKPLPGHLSFGRLLCFEGGFGSAGTKPPQVIGAVFRCLIPILNNREGSVIMPLLASGDQGYSEKLVLQQVMNAAVNWMRAGLPLRTLKVVLFSRHPEKMDNSFEPLFELFQEFKDKYEDKEVDDQKTDSDGIGLNDIYLSHCPNDHNTALQVRKFFEAKHDVSIFDDIQELNEEESWQEDIYNTMVKCSRVITLLSPGYLASESCIEQYNMALCISRRTHKEVLAPFYITNVESLPTYMGLIQYIDCRPRDQEKLKNASYALQEWLDDNNNSSSSTSLSNTKPVTREDYDVFISYSHCNDNEAMMLLESLKTHDPKLKVFIDTSGLNTGSSWQQTLYHAMDKAKTMVALLSPDYVKSKVCKEEFSLALALHLDSARDFQLVSMVVEPVQELPVWCHKPIPVDCTSMDVNVVERMSAVVRNIVEKRKGSADENDDLESRHAHLQQEQVSIDEFTQRYRKIHFVNRNMLLSEPVTFTGKQSSERTGHAHDVVFATNGHHQSIAPSENPADTKSSSADNACDVALSFAEEDAKAAVTIKQLLLERYPALKLSEPQTKATSRLSSLDVARVIIPLLSAAFLNSKELVEELNIALYRNRCSSQQVVYPIQLSALPLRPTYVHLIPCDFAANDVIWKRRALGNKMSSERFEQLAHDNDIDEGVARCLIDATDVIAKRLSNKENTEENQCQVLLNASEVQYTWSVLRESLEKESGLETVKRAFGIEVIAGKSEETAENKETTEEELKGVVIYTSEKKEAESDNVDGVASDEIKENERNSVIKQVGPEGEQVNGPTGSSRPRAVSFSPNVKFSELRSDGSQGDVSQKRKKSSTCRLF